MGMTNNIFVEYLENRFDILKIKLCGKIILKGNGAPGAIRTPDRWYRKPVLYPAELRAHTNSVKRPKL